MDAKESRRVSREVVGRGAWMQVAEVRYKHRAAIQSWTVCERTRPNAPDNAPPPKSDHICGVDVCAIMENPHRSEKGDRKIVVISQYRPPADAVIIELPAGLVEPGETLEAAAARELYEETGYTGTVVASSKSLPLAHMPGLTNSCFAFVTVKVDGTLKANHTPKPRPEEDEDIAVHLISHGPTMLQELEELARKLNSTSTVDVPVRVSIVGKLYTYASALAVQAAFNVK